MFSSLQTYKQNSPKTGRVLALSNTAVKHNDRPSCHFDYFNLNAPNSRLFFSFRHDIVYTETSLKKKAGLSPDEPSRIPESGESERGNCLK